MCVSSFYYQNFYSTGPSYLVVCKTLKELPALIEMNYFLVFSVLLLQHHITSALPYNQCPKYCHCEVSNEPLIACEKGNSSLIIKLAPTIIDSLTFWESDKKGTELTINCTTFDQLAYEIGPQLNVSDLISVVYNNCPLPLNGSLSLGFSNLDGIRFATDTPIEYGTFSKDHFEGLTSLYELRLLSNTTFNLADDAFAGFSQLKKLYLHSNRINFEIFKSLPNVGKLEIGFVNGEFNLDGLKSCEKLGQINLANLEISHLTSRIFENLPASVDTILFYDNKFNTIDSNVFETVSKLSYVRFSGNFIQNWPSHFNNDNLQYFQILGDHESIPDELLSNLPKLRDVDIHCNLKSIPENLFKGSSHLNIVNLTGNQLTDLPENLLANQTDLFHLYLDQNRFDVLPENLITNLMTKPSWVTGTSFILSFKSNRIQSISEKDLRLLIRKEAEYDFSDNLITDLSVFNKFRNEFQNFERFFNFNGNPIVCDCEKIETFRRFLKNRRNIYHDYESKSLKCASPANLKGTAVIDVQCDDVEE